MRMNATEDSQHQEAKLRLWADGNAVNRDLLFMQNDKLLVFESKFKC